MSTPLVNPQSNAGVPTALRPRVSESVYWERYYAHSDRCYEWNAGSLEEKPVSDHLTYLIYAWFVELLTRFLKASPIAETVGLEIGFRLALPGRVAIRKPDLGVVRHDNAIHLNPLDRSYRGVLDLCVEALSDSSVSEKWRGQVVKKSEYAAGGVAEYYILHHREENLAFYRLSPQEFYEPMASTDGIVRSRVLPGFRFRKRDLLLRTPLDDLRADSLYRDLLFPHWQRAERERDALVRDRREAIAKLETMGLTRDQIAEALAVDLDTVADVLSAR